MTTVKGLARGKVRYSPYPSEDSNSSIDSIDTLVVKVNKCLPREDVIETHDSITSNHEENDGMMPSQDSAQPELTRPSDSEKENKLIQQSEHTGPVKNPAKKQTLSLNDYFNVAISNRYGCLSDTNSVQHGTDEMDTTPSRAPMNIPRNRNLLRRRTLAPKRNRRRCVSPPE